MTMPGTPWWATRKFAIAMMIVSVIPLLWPVVPPLVDLPGHMGRYAVQLAPADSPLHKWFSFEWGVIGNLGVDLLVMPLGRIFGVELAVKLIVMMIPPLTVAGMLLVAREAHGEVPPTAAFALPLAYGYPFQFGFVNFALSMALALLGFALWLRLGRTKHRQLRAIVFVPYGIALWFVHSFGWGVLGLIAFASDLVRRHGRGKPWIKSAWEAGLAVVPLMPPMALMLLWRSGHVTGRTGDFFNWTAKNFYLQNILRNEGTPFDWGSGMILVLIALIGMCGIGFRRNPLLTLAAAILTVTYICLPRVAIGSAYADMRLAPYMIAVALLALVPMTRDRKVQNAIALVATGFFLVRMADQTVSYVTLDRGFKAQMEALDHVPRGARIFTLSNLQCLSTPHSTRLDHIEAMGLVRKEAFTNGQWVMAGAQLLRLNYPDAPGYNDDPSQIIRPGKCKQPGSHVYPQVIGQFPRKAFDYLWLVNFAPDQWPMDDPGLVPAWQGARGAMYKIRQTPSGD